MRRATILTVLLLAAWSAAGSTPVTVSQGVATTAPARVPVTVSGRVSDTAGAPLPYASVTVKGRMTGAVAAKDGSFTLTLPDSGEYTLAASYVGYETQEMRMAGGGTVDFRLSAGAMGINTVVVTGTRTPKLLKDAPVLTRVITADDIRRSDATHIGDLLEGELPGVEFSYSMNQQVSLNMQGFGGTSVLFLVDGQRLAGETLDNVDYSRLGLGNVERVEIVKGAASSLYGSNAVGGVVNIITKGAEKPWAVGLDARYGTHNAQRYGITAAFDRGRVNSVTELRHTSRDSYSLGGAGDFTTLFGNHTYSFNERLAFRASDRVDLLAKAGYYFRERDSQPSIKDRYRGFSGSLAMDWRIAEGRTLEAHYAFDQYDKSYFYPTNGKDIRNYSNIQNTAGALYNHGLAGGHTLTVGADGMTDYLMSYQFEENTSHDRYSADVFAQFDWRAAERLTVVGGARLDWYSGGGGAHLSPKVAAMWRAGRFALRGSYAGGFRAPTLKEMYMNFFMGDVFMIYGNPALGSETSHNFTLSGEYTAGRVNASVSGYYNMVSDRISTVWNTALNGMQYVNTKRVNVAGAEAGVAFRLANGFGGMASYAYTHESVRRGEVRTSDTRPHTAILRLCYGRTFRNYGFDLTLSGRYMSAVETNVLTQASGYRQYEWKRYPAYTMWKLIAAQRFGRAVTLTATVDNIFNYKPDYFYYNSPVVRGTVFSVGLSVNLESVFTGR